MMRSDDVVRLRVARIHGGVFLDTRGSAMDVYNAARSWVRSAASEEQDREEIWERFGTRLASLVDEAAPDSGFRAGINRPLQLVWFAAWPWAPNDAFNTDEGWQWAPGLTGRE